MTLLTTEAPTEKVELPRIEETNVDRKLEGGMRVQGHVRRGFEPLLDTFVENFARRRELGGACCVYRHGEKVADLWGGVRNKETGEAWERETMVLVHSTTKGLAAMTLALAHSRGWLDYEAPVCRYWPEFAQAGKETITIRQLPGHSTCCWASRFASCWM